MPRYDDDPELREFVARGARRSTATASGHSLGSAASSWSCSRSASDGTFVSGSSDSRRASPEGSSRGRRDVCAGVTSANPSCTRTSHSLKCRMHRRRRRKDGPNCGCDKRRPFLQPARIWLTLELTARGGAGVLHRPERGTVAPFRTFPCFPAIVAHGRTDVSLQRGMYGRDVVQCDSSSDAQAVQRADLLAPQPPTTTLQPPAWTPRRRRAKTPRSRRATTI